MRFWGTPAVEPLHPVSGVDLNQDSPPNRADIKCAYFFTIARFRSLRLIQAVLAIK